MFAAATGRRPLADAVNELTELGAVAANVLARAVARGVFEARALPGRHPELAGSPWGATFAPVAAGSVDFAPN